jgi:hypothetical protein
MRRAVIALVATLLIGGCSAGGGASPSSGGGSAASNDPSAAGSLGRADPAQRDRCLESAATFEHPVIGRKLTAAEVDALMVTLEAAFPSRIQGRDVSVFLLTDGAHDFDCIARPDDDSQQISLSIFDFPVHYPDKVGPQDPLVVGPVGGNQVWGAVDPSVARVEVTWDPQSLSGDPTPAVGPAVIEAVISNGYFLSFMGDDGMWLPRTVTAYDAAGQQIAAK